MSSERKGKNCQLYEERPVRNISRRNSRDRRKNERRKKREIQQDRAACVAGICIDKRHRPQSFESSRQLKREREN